MKKLTIIILTLFALILTACAATDSAAAATVIAATAAPQMDSVNAAPTNSAPSTTLTTNDANAPSVLEQLLAGTFLLEGTDNAVTAEQAAVLVPLWTSLKETMQNTSATQEQITAIIEQIQSAMTPEQLTAITSMQITRESIRTTLQQLGITMGGGNGTNPNGGTPPEGTPPAGGPGGGGNGGGTPPQGTPSAGGPGGGGDPSQMATPQAGQSPQGGMNFVPPELIDALLQFLQAKISS